MRIFKKFLIGIFTGALLLCFFRLSGAFAATTPSLGLADSFSILTHTYSRNGNPAPIITGDFGYLSLLGGAPMPTVSGETYVGGSIYTQAMTDRTTALTALNNQPCTFTFPAGNVDLATDTSHGPVGVYTPGVYCTTEQASASIGASGITLSGNGTYIFRIHGSLSTAANSVVTLAAGASACDVFWTANSGSSPAVFNNNANDIFQIADLGAGSSTFGYNSKFVGTYIDAGSMIITDNVTWQGRILMNGTVEAASDFIITAPDSCALLPSLATLRIVKTFRNTYGGTAVPANAVIHVKNGAGDVAGSPHVGVGSPGIAYTLEPGVYTIDEDVFAGYTARYDGDCDASGYVTLVAGDNKICAITNSQNPLATTSLATLHIIKQVINNNGGQGMAANFNLHVKDSVSLSDVKGSPAVGVEAPGTSYGLVAGTYIVGEDISEKYSQSFSGDCDEKGRVTLAAGDNKICTVTNDDIESLPLATLHVIKIVVNDNSGQAIASQAIVHVTNDSGDVKGSPQAGAGSPGTSYSLVAGSYNVSENFFSGYAVAIGGDCAANGSIKLAPGDNKTCIITNNDIVETTTTTDTSTTTPPTVSVPANCNVCARLTYDVYIVNPDLSERHTGTSWARVMDRGNGIKRYSFEDATLDPNSPLYDYNDSVVDVDFKSCQSVKFMFVSSDASWKHQIRIKVSIDGIEQSDILVTDDSRAAVGTSKTINASSGVSTKLACSPGPAASMGLLGKILLQVQQHGEAWYVNPVSGLRYYMKDGLAAYSLMRSFGLGITDKDLATIPAVATVEELKKSTSVCSVNGSANKLKGKILLQVQQHGEAWYVDVGKCRRLYLKDGAAAYTLMRFLGLGISDANLNKLTMGW